MQANKKPFENTEDVVSLTFDKMTTETLRQLLFYNENVEVTFIKKSNGEERVMNCTLHPAFVPEPEFASKSEKKRRDAQGVVKAYDRDKNAWRSFTEDSVVTVRYVSPAGEPIELKKGIVIGKPV